MRDGSTYRAARRNAALRPKLNIFHDLKASLEEAIAISRGEIPKEAALYSQPKKRDWRSLPYAELRLKHSAAKIVVRAVPTKTEPPQEHKAL